MDPSCSGPLCKVCGAEKAGNHYNGMVCGCCRIFFFRQTRRARQPQCRRQGQCTITAGATDNCQHCRYKKCLEIGMKPSDVGKQKYTKKRRKESSEKDQQTIIITDLIEVDSMKPSEFMAHNSVEAAPAVIACEPDNWIVDQYHKPEPRWPNSMSSVESNFSAGFMVLNTLRCAKSASDYINCLTSLQSFVDNPKGVDPIEVYANVEVSLADVLLNSQAAWDKWTPEPDAHFSIKHVYCRSITRYVDYLTAAPELFNLPDLDKMRLIQSNSTDLTILGSIYEMWKNNVDMSDKYMIERGKRFHLASSAQETLDKMQIILAPYMEHLIEKMNLLGMRTGEFLILKYIVFFTAPVGISPTGKCIINVAREKYCNLLSNYLLEMDPQMPWSIRLKRVADLISMVRMIKEAAIFVKQLYANFASTNTGGMAGSLTFDLHLREY